MQEGRSKKEKMCRVEDTLRLGSFRNMPRLNLNPVHDSTQRIVRTKVVHDRMVGQLQRKKLGNY